MFTPPTWRAVQEATWEEACRINQEETGKRISRQVWGISGKIREANALLAGDLEARGRVREVHPEVLFWGLNGKTAMQHRKRAKERAGFRERLAVLRRWWPSADTLVGEALGAFRRRDVGFDDILDALAAGVTALVGGEKLFTMPPRPPVDGRGLPMEIVYWTPGISGAGEPG